MEQKNYSFVLHIVKTNVKVPLEDFSLIPENTLGSHILRDPGHVGKITLNIFRPKKKYDFTVSDTPKEVFEISSFYNLAASLQKCFIYHTFKLNNDDEAKNATSLAIKVVTSDLGAIKMLDQELIRLKSVEPKKL